MRRQGAHVRAFASEVLTAIYIMSCFLHVTVVPLGLIPDHVAAFDALVLITTLLRSGDDVMDQLPALRCLIRDHNSMFMRLYNDVAKPKLHYLQHIAMNLSRPLDPSVPDWVAICREHNPRQRFFRCRVCPQYVEVSPSTQSGLGREPRAQVMFGDPRRFQIHFGKGCMVTA